ncbi:hypothetical protein SAMN05444369_10980 [Capnocytophaga haemolytica]|jgi:hypothetical protein|uniref:DUF4468 domain-containing protein n=1 Tax=Capnocytophaga haemolytica TaxID=45243 RepID=A0AAX2GYV2_9FLAO|nr:hypothetical protein [Capnocytophaga haemolytica]AMD84396.1 hypothetical protein AXF12_01900 [Capnocytophaga haemolytica]SFO10668.1 hypothetical protein SAMN05444369_10980 [Capnocytophaga haemolytica]SNV10807.1 Uncharacterised protein [Capnocytophaga haemolytica]
MKRLFLLLTAMVATQGFAQRVTVEEGNLKSLAGTKQINVVFDYTQMHIGKDNLTEKAYVAEHTEWLNKKSVGKGDSWAKSWAIAKEMLWQPKFIELVNVIMKKAKKDIVFKEGDSEAPITLTVNTLWIYQGWDAGVMKQPAKVTTSLVFTDKSGKVLCKLLSEEAPGDQYGSNFNDESRLAEGYAKTGKTLGKLIEKALK